MRSLQGKCLSRPALKRMQHARRALQSQSILVRHASTKSTEPDPQPVKQRVKSLQGIIGGGVVLCGIVFYSSENFGWSGDRPSFKQTYELHSRTPFSKTSSIYTLRPQSIDSGILGSLETGEIWRNGTWSIDFIQPELQIVRSYTPLPPRTTDDLTGDVKLSFLMRDEMAGEMSQYLKRLPSNAKISVRAPYTDYELPQDVSDIVFLAGGTGIAPAMQIAFALHYRYKTLNDPESKVPGFAAHSPVRMSILWANRKEDDAYGVDSSTYPGPIVKQIESISESPATPLDLKIFIDDKRKRIERRDLQNALKTTPSSSGRRIIIISGPDGFVNSLAGSKAQPHVVDRHVNGVPGGELSKTDLTGWEIIKLRT